MRNRSEQKRSYVRLAATALTYFALASVSLAQTSVVCDAAGDASSSSGKGGPIIPAWLDIRQSEITDAGSDIHFTLTLNAAVPTAPAWSHVEDGGQLWWGWRFVDDVAKTTLIKDGCIKSPGNLILAAYFLDVIWDVTDSNFRARLLDDTTCDQIEVPFVFSSDRRQITLVLSKNLLTNQVLIPNPNAFDHFALTAVWKPNKTGNCGFTHVDSAPNETDEGLVVAPWSASENATFLCQ